MRLSAAQSAELEQWLAARGVPPNCRLCNGTKYGYRLGDLDVRTDENRPDQFKSWPVIFITCLNCGDIRSIPGKSIGLA